MSVYNAEVTQQRQRARSGGKGGRERSLAEGTKLIRPASVLPMRPLHATAAAANVDAVLNAVLPSPPSSSPSSAQSAAALPLQNQPCLRRLSVVMLVQIARRGTREGGRRILCGMHGRVQIKRSEEGLRKEKREGEMGLVCERASESATHMYAYVVHYLLQSADKIKRKASDRWTDADGPWTDRRTEQRVVTRGPGRRQRAGETEGGRVSPHGARTRYRARWRSPPHGLTETNYPLGLAQPAQGDAAGVGLPGC